MKFKFRTICYELTDRPENKTFAMKHTLFLLFYVKTLNIEWTSGLNDLHSWLFAF